MLRAPSIIHFGSTVTPPMAAVAVSMPCTQSQPAIVTDASRPGWSAAMPPAIHPPIE